MLNQGIDLNLSMMTVEIMHKEQSGQDVSEDVW